MLFGLSLTTLLIGVAAGLVLVQLYPPSARIGVWIIVTGVVCLFVGWNVPQPLFAQKLENRVRAKLRLETKTLRQ